MKKGKILLASMIILTVMPTISFAYHYAPERYIQTLSPDQIKSLQCTFKKIYKAGSKISTCHPIEKLMAIKTPYNTWPLARRQLLRQRLEYMKEILDELINEEPYQADAIANLQMRVRALNNTGCPYRR